VSGAVTMDTVNALFTQGLGLSRDNAVSAITVDFSQLEKVDSSAVSLMLTWLREAQKSNTALHFSNVPKNLISLAKLYGVADLLNLSVA
jgi:phospholipid transport system transporter-binding protein